MWLHMRTIAVACVAALLVGASISGAGAQTAAPEFKQVKLNDKHVQGFIAAQKDISGIADELQKAGDKPDPKLQAKLEGIATKHGFSSFAELDDVAANISIVMAGIDPQSGAYTDPLDAIKKEMDDVKKDAAIPEKDKKQMLTELEEALKTTPPLQYKENIELVKKFQKDIEKALQ